ADNASAEDMDLTPLLKTLQKDAQLSAPEQLVHLTADPELLIKGWPTMIERAVDNLLRNAQRFNPQGQPIELQAQRHGERILISVRDHGPGVDAEHLSQLGEPFFRAPGQVAQGHGLGLAIARRAAERHRGTLTLANPPDGGFIASIDLPLEPGGVTA
ncbi:sensor histidine kinase, partial [Helicobacter pullorum NCTC 12824]